MLGLEKAKPGKFALWHRMKGNYAEPEHAGEARRNAAIHAEVAAHVLTHPSLALAVQINPKEREHPELPIEGRADGIVGEDPRFGQGRGVAIVEEVTGHEWTREWHDENGVAMAPPAVRARMEGVFLLYGVKWGIIIPQVGWRHPRPPIVAHPDEALRSELRREIWALHESLEKHRAPVPDARAEIGALAALAKACPSRRTGTVEIDEQVRAELRALIEEAERRQEEMNEAWNAMTQLRGAYRNATVNVVGLLNREGLGAASIDIGERIVQMSVEESLEAPERRQWVKIDIEAQGDLRQLVMRE